MQEERLNYLSVLSVENDITKSLPMKRRSKSMQPNMLEKVLYICICVCVCVCVCVSGSYLIKILCYFSEFCDACGFCQLF